MGVGGLGFGVGRLRTVGFRQGFPLKGVFRGLGFRVSVPFKGVYQDYIRYDLRV